MSTKDLPVRLITADDIDGDGNFTGILPLDDEGFFVGHIKIAAKLGYVTFSGHLLVRGRIAAMAGSGIKAGLGIKAGEGIKAGFSINAQWLSSRLRIFAGLCLCRLPTPEEMEVRAELRGGVIAFGTHVPPTEAPAPQSL